MNDPHQMYALAYTPTDHKALTIVIALILAIGFVRLANSLFHH